MRGLVAVKGNLIWEQGGSEPLREAQVQVKIHATAVNRADILQLAGLYPPPAGESEILGLEMAGEVIEIGPRVTTLKKGSRVCALLGSGGYASHCTIDERRCIPIPHDFSYEQAAAIPESFITALANLPQFPDQLSDNANVLVRAAASGVGVAFLQLALSRSIHSNVYGLVGSEEKASKLQNLFPKTKIFYSEDSLIESTGNDYFTSIINLVGGKTVTNDIRLAAPTGTITLLATLAGRTADLDISQVLKKRLTITGSTLRARSVEEKIALTTRFTKELLPLFEKKVLIPVIDKIFPLLEADKAIKYVEQRKNVGKVILKVL